jgi:hypothetical protein
LSVNPYAPPKAAVADVEPAAKVATPFFAVSKKKLVILSIATGTLYQLVWFYLNWLQIRRSGATVAPLVRTLFAPLFCYALFDRVRWYRKDLPSSRLPAGLLTTGWIALTLISEFLSRFDARGARTATVVMFFVSLLVGHASVLFILPVQSAIDSINRAEAPDHDPNDRFTVWNWIWIFVLGSLVLLGIADVLLTGQ